MGRSTSSESSDVDVVDAIEFSEDFEEEEAIKVENPTALQAVQISARNILRAKVKQIVKGKVNAEVTLVIAPGVELVSIVTRTSAENLGLKKGKEVFAVIKSSNVMIAAE
jgi:molybdopterin-binding protein